MPLRGLQELFRGGTSLRQGRGYQRYLVCDAIDWCQSPACQHRLSNGFDLHRHHAQICSSVVVPYLSEETTLLLILWSLDLGNYIRLCHQMIEQGHTF